MGLSDPSTSWGGCTLAEWSRRLLSCFSNKRHHIPELIEFDRKHGVKSTYFFGMNQGLSMSYKPKEAKEMMNYVINNGCNIGVHGICYDNLDGIKQERERFHEVMGFYPHGLRMHYVRYDDSTFNYLSNAGYLYDSTEFDKPAKGSIKSPYKVGNMWEFPLSVMDGYLDYNFEKAQAQTLAALDKANALHMEYFTILFHDALYTRAYKEYVKWYEWMINFFESEDGFEFCSFEQAVSELEQKS